MALTKLELHQQKRELLTLIVRKLEWFASAVGPGLFSAELAADLRDTAKDVAQQRDDLVPALHNPTAFGTPRGRRRRPPADNGNDQAGAQQPPAKG